MNQNDSLRLLINELKKYGSSIIVHKNFYSEFQNIITRSGMEASIINEFIAKLEYLNEHKRQAPTLYSQKFEWLKSVDLYSMHIEKKKYNIRILYQFTDNDNIILLLCAFNEKGGKSSTDYSKPIKFAKQRIEEYM